MNKFWPALLNRKSGTLEIKEKTLVFSHSDLNNTNLIISLVNLQISVEKGNSYHYFLFDPSTPSMQICVQTIEPIKLLAAMGILSAQKSLTHTTSQHRKKFTVLSTFFALLIILTIGLPIFFLSAPLGWINSLVSHSEEEKISSIILPLMANNSTEDHPAQPKVVKIIEYLAKYNPELQSLKIKIYISPDLAINAFAFPGEIIVVNLGLLQEAKTIDEIAGVLAHELGHIEARHTLKGLASKFGFIIGIGFITLLTGPDAATWISRTTSILSLKYSRSDELDADKRGIEFLMKANIPVTGLITFFGRSKNESWFTNMFNFLSTHPMDQERIDQINKLTKKYIPLPKEKLPLSLEDFQSIL